MNRKTDNQNRLTTYVFQFNIETNDHINELVDRSYMSRVGIVRMAIDFLYYTSNNIEIPDELKEVLKDLKNEVKIN
jgi:hypothetical protein